MNLWTATSCLPLLAAAFALWYRRNAETRVPLTSPGKLEKDVSVPAWGRVMGRDAMRKFAQGRARSSFSPKRCPIWRRERGARAGSGPQTAGSAMSTGRDIPSLLTSRSARASMSSPRRRDSSHASTQPGLASETASSSTRFPGMPLRCAKGFWRASLGSSVRISRLAPLPWVRPVRNQGFGTRGCESTREEALASGGGSPYEE